jgi:hypothetical protein
MKIKIIKNNPPNTEINNYNDISKYIGRIFKVIDTIKYDVDGKPNDGVIVIIDGEKTEIYEGEYEKLK